MAGDCPAISEDMLDTQLLREALGLPEDAPEALVVAAANLLQWLMDVHRRRLYALELDGGADHAT